MRAILRLFLSLGLIAGAMDVQASRAEEPASPGPGPGPRPAAEFKLGDYSGQVVLLDFWASWCAPCRQSLPWLNAMQEKYGDQGLQVVTVNLDQDGTAAEAMSASQHAGIAQYRDPAGTLAEQFKLEGMPTSFLYDRSGTLVSCEVGFVKADGPKRDLVLQEILARKE